MKPHKGRSAVTETLPFVGSRLISFDVLLVRNVPGFKSAFLVTAASELVVSNFKNIR